MIRHLVTAIIPTKNESHCITKALDSVLFADEIIIIDSYSTDDTIKKAKEHHKDVVIIQRKFDDFSSQKNAAIEQASNEWILILDADEEINNELKNEILKTLENPTHHAYWVYRSNYFMGKTIRFSGWQNDKVIRLFNKKHGKYHGNVHEEIVCTSNKYAFLKNKLLHHSYVNWQHYLNKQDQYTSLQAEKLYQQEKNVNLIFHLLIKPCFKFFNHYFIRLGILDGTRGFIISYIQAHNILNRYVKLWQLKNNLK
jgi:glycosyltransferase involved in cell wall biosynthesis